MEEATCRGGQWALGPAGLVTGGVRRGLFRFALAAAIGLLFLFLGARRVEGAEGAGAAGPVAAADLEGRAAELRPGAGLQGVGPCASPLAGELEVELSEAGRVVTYRWGERERVVFRLVEPRNGRPAFVATAEVSVGLFTDLLRALGKTREFARLMPACGGGFDARKGPRTWRWSSGGARVGPMSSWVLAMPGVKPYPEGFRAGRPTRSHPVQYVSAEAAACFAALLGCRIPTSAEWEAAWRADRADGATPNLRDAAWVRQREYVRGVFAKGLVGEWPDAGVFVPPGMSVARGEAAAAVTASDDGVLWFAPVRSGSGFEHLVGNVAEFVFEKPGLLDEARKAAGIEKLATLVRAHGAEVRVVGGSALSPPELWDGRTRPFSKAWPVGAGGTSRGYSDVGFRLAFTAPASMGGPKRLAAARRRR